MSNPANQDRATAPRPDRRSRLLRFPLALLAGLTAWLLADALIQPRPRWRLDNFVNSAVIPLSETLDGRWLVACETFKPPGGRLGIRAFLVLDSTTGQTLGRLVPLEEVRVAGSEVVTGQLWWVPWESDRRLWRLAEATGRIELRSWAPGETQERVEMTWKFGPNEPLRLAISRGSDPVLVAMRPWPIVSFGPLGGVPLDALIRGRHEWILAKLTSGTSEAEALNPRCFVDGVCPPKRPMVS